MEIFDESPWKVFRENNVEIHVFLLDRWEGEPWNRAKDEHDEIRWVEPKHTTDFELAHPLYESLLLEAALRADT